MKKKIVQGVTSSLSVLFIKDQVDFIRKNGYELKVVCNNDFQSPHEGIDTEHIPFEREISFVKDVSALYKLIKYLNREKPDIIHFSTPKAGLLGMVAGFVNRIQTRIYMIRGLRMETTKGIKKMVLYMTERIACTFSTHVIVISDSMEREVLKMNIVRKDKIFRIGKGSSNGINLDKFNPENINNERLRNLKDKLQIQDKDFIIGYVGRLTKDKGINELVEAFEELSVIHSNIKLLLIGDFEVSDAIDEENIQKIHDYENIIYCEFTDGLDYYYCLMDLFALPTYREGFSNVSIEAQAMNVPVVTFNSTGARDTVDEGRTGLVTMGNDKNSLKKALNYLITDYEKRHEMSQVSRKFIVDNFDRKMMQQQLLEFYDSLREQENQNVEKSQKLKRT